MNRCLATLDEWASRVAAETARNFHQFRDNPQEFRNSEGYFRMLLLVTVLQQDFGLRYNPARSSTPEQMEPDSVFFADSQDLFLHGILGPRRMGTCVSMPVLYVAVGRRLGYPLKLVTAKGHLFARWEGAERFNIEGTNAGLTCHPDEHYRTWPYPISQAEWESGHYLKSLTPEQELGLFVATRGQCLLHNGRLGEAREAFARAVELAPDWPEHAAMLARVRAGLGNGAVFANAWQPAVSQSEGGVTRRPLLAERMGIVQLAPPTGSADGRDQRLATAAPRHVSQQARAEIDAHAERVEALNRENRARMEAQFRQFQSPSVPAMPFRPAVPK